MDNYEYDNCFALKGPLASPRHCVLAHVLFSTSDAHCHFTRHSFFPGYSTLYSQDSHSTLRIHIPHSGFIFHTQNSHSTLRIHIPHSGFTLRIHTPHAGFTIHAKDTYSTLRIPQTINVAEYGVVTVKSFGPGEYPT